MPLPPDKPINNPVHHFINRAENLSAFDKHLVKLRRVGDIKVVPAYTVPLGSNTLLGRAARHLVFIYNFDIANSFSVNYLCFAYDDFINQYV